MVIYKITNKVNGKIYIGKTITDSPDYYGSGLLIRRAINKYNKNNFKKEIIDTATTLAELNKKECFWINYYNSTNMEIGYNIGKGGDGGDIFTNHPNKEEIRQKYKNRVGDKNGMFGKKHSDSSIKKISKNKKGQRKGIPTWNKGLETRNYSEKYIKMYLETKNRQHVNAKLFIFISPEYQEFEVFGKFKDFCDKNNLDVYTARHFINKGSIPPPQKGTPKKKRVNLIGWTITCKL